MANLTYECNRPILNVTLKSHHTTPTKQPIALVSERQISTTCLYFETERTMYDLSITFTYGKRHPEYNDFERIKDAVSLPVVIRTS